MWFLDQIIYRLNTIKEWFLEAYLEVNGWIAPFRYLATPLWYIYYAFIYLVSSFRDFNTWVSDAAAKLLTILSYSNIASYFKTFFDAATNAWSWVVNAWGNVTGIVNIWWSSTQQVVLSWINDAVTFLLSLIGNLQTWLGTLQEAWDAFKGMIPSISEILAWFSNWWAWILARILAWGGLPARLIQDLIDSTLLAWFPFYNTLAEIWSAIVEFFADPLEFLWARFTDWFLGREE
ncbi:hypothetical protein ES708_15434 [subsurface metagenome]